MNTESARNIFPNVSSVQGINHLVDKMPINDWLRECEKLDYSHIPKSMTPTLRSDSDWNRKILRGFKIVPVDMSNVDKAQELLRTIFPNETAHFEITFVALKKPYYEHETMKIILRSESWLVVTDNDSEEAVAILGLSYFLDDYKEAIWGDWYGVSPSYRKIGLGAATSLFCLEKGILSNKKFLRLMTEDLEEANNANKFYDYMGIEIVHEEKLSSCTRIWRQKKINGDWSTVLFFYIVRSLQLFIRLTTNKTKPWKLYNIYLSINRAIVLWLFRFVNISCPRKK